MEQYPLPQFIDKESNVAFFISFRQFFYLVGAGIISFFLYWTGMPSTLFYVIVVVLFLLAAILGFGMINGTPILTVLLNSVGFSMGGKNYVWKKAEYPYPFKPIQRTNIKKIDRGPVLQAQTSQLKRTKMGIDLKTK